MARTSLQGLRVWVTGASAGIGRAVAVELARRGCKVALSARTASALESLAAELGPDRALALPMDVTDREANREAVERIEAAWGGLDLAFLNAGTCEYVDVARFDAALFERTMTSNFMSMVYGIEAALPALRRSPAPRLVGVASMVAFGAMPRAEAYGASKAAIRHMLQSLRIDLAAERIPVTVVLPGFVRTPLTDRNDFPMPMRVEPDWAARVIADGLERGRREIWFPRIFGFAYKLLALLPGPMYTAVVRGLVKRP